MEDLVSFPWWQPNPPPAISDSALLGPLIWFPFWQIKGFPLPFLYHNFFQQYMISHSQKKKKKQYSSTLYVVFI
jgi:hypothetical protein